MAQADESGNFLYYGDNLDILRRYIKDESVDLVYLDPPFKSNQSYNVLFAERNGRDSAAQIRAFEDTWHWDRAAARAYEDIVEAGGAVSQAMQALRSFLGQSDMTAYLAMMAPRLAELHRVLKPSGSIYLHCDPTASHYLKMLLDAVFGPENFRNEIIWKRAQPKAHVSLRMSRAHDVILFFAKSSRAKYHQQYRPHDPDYVEKFYKFVEEGTGRRYTLDNLANPNKNRPNLTYEFPPGSGVVRVWRWTKERMQKEWEGGRVILPERGGVVRYKRYLDEMEGAGVTDVWDDIEHLHGSHHESLGYPTQKPEALLERIINTSSEEGDRVLDPFCGCGTTVSVAQRLNRRWTGIDVTHLAVRLIRRRLRNAFGNGVSYKVIGQPQDLSGARQLAESDPYEFQWWALSLLETGREERKKGADRGIDGRVYFHDEAAGGKTKQIILSVKSGHVSVAQVRDLRGVLEREEAEIGVLITLREPTRAMLKEAAGSGFYESPGWRKKYPRIQIVTIEDLLAGKGIDYPPSRQVDTTFRKAPKAGSKTSKQKDLPC